MQKIYASIAKKGASILTLVSLFASFLVFTAPQVGATFSNVDCTNAAHRLILGGGTTALQQSDCEFLEDIWALNGPNWTNAATNNWDTLTDIGTTTGTGWLGVRRSSGRVNQLSLASNNLSGDITSLVLPSALALFTVGLNQLSGDVSAWTLPSTLSTMHLSGNQFTGDISAWVLPAGLKIFGAYDNELSGDLSSWPLPVGLTIFSLQGNNFSGDVSNWIIPSTIVFFDISDNSFTGEIGSIWNPQQYPSVERFRFGGTNQLSGDISNWSLPSALQQFRADNQKLMTGNLTNWVMPTGLTRFILGNNTFTGNISSWNIPQTTTVFNVSNNAFSGDLPTFASGILLDPGINPSSLAYNKFFTADTSKLQNISTLFNGEDILSTQTIPPTGAQILSQSGSTLELGIDAYAFTASGSYDIYYGTTQSGAYNLGPITQTRSTGTGITLSGLTPNTLYYGVVVASTPANLGGNALSATGSEFQMMLQSTPVSPTTTNDTTPEITGSCFDGATVTLYVNGGAVTPTAVCTGGVYSITPTTALSPDGSYIIQTTQTLGLYTTPLSPSLEISLDTIAPIQAEITSVDGDTTTPYVTNDTTPDVIITAETGSTVTIAGWTCTPTPVTSSGSVTCTPDTVLAEGNTTINPSITDVSGNETTGPSTSIIVDTTKPIINNPNPNTQTIKRNRDLTLLPVTCSDNYDITCTVTQSGSVDTTQTGTYTITYTATDSSGNTTTNTINIQVIPSGGNSNSGDNRDICPNGDLSGNLYDRLCSSQTQTNTNTNTNTSTSNTGTTDTPEETPIEEEIIDTTTEESSIDQVVDNAEAEIDAEISDIFASLKKVSPEGITYTLTNSYDSCSIIDALNTPNYEIQRNLFQDISDEQIDLFGTLGIIQGTKEGNFEPERNITRAEFTKMVLISHCYDYQDEDTKTRTYTDLKEDTWEARVVSKAEKLGIINGYIDDTFRPDQIISKAEGTKILMRMAMIETEESGTLNYEDIQEEWQKKYVEIGESLGIFDSQEDRNTFRPNDGMTRRFMLQMIQDVVRLYR